MKSSQLMSLCFTIAIVAILLLSGGVPAIASERSHVEPERSGFFSTLRERQIENRRELQENMTPTREEVRENVREDVRSAIADFATANERLATAAHTIIERRNRLFEAGYPTSDLDALLRESITMILDNQNYLRIIYSDISEGVITTREQLSTRLIDVRGEILATQDLLIETWRLLQGDVE